MSQEFIFPQESQKSEELSAHQVFPAENSTAPGGERASVSTQGLDELLADIDSVLEKNAEEFVSGFVQKGGQ